MWRWVDKRLLLVLHDESLAMHGGLSGIRDEGLLDSALARPEHLAVYGEPDIAALAASYGVGLAKNHPFVDGNKRAAFLAVGLFLMINGCQSACKFDHPSASNFDQGFKLISCAV
jgi:death-on-curing protein